MLVVHRWSIAAGLALLAWFAVLPPASGAEPTPVQLTAVQPTPAQEGPVQTPLAANCSCLPLHWCIKAPYTCKPGPCPPSPCYATTCDKYCAKPFPCLPTICQQWCKDGYCPKPPVCCFPGDPCPPCETKKHGKK